MSIQCSSVGTNGRNRTHVLLWYSCIAFNIDRVSSSANQDGWQEDVFHKYFSFHFSFSKILTKRVIDIVWNDCMWPFGWFLNQAIFYWRCLLIQHYIPFKQSTMLPNVCTIIRIPCIDFGVCLIQIFWLIIAFLLAFISPKLESIKKQYRFHLVALNSNRTHVLLAEVYFWDF